MKHEAKLTSRRQHEQEQAQAEAQIQQPAVHEFANPEEMLRHDALHTPVPPRIADRLETSLRETPPAPLPWWRRLFGGTNP
jgi:hypothetical protein